MQCRPALTDLGAQKWTLRSSYAAGVDPQQPEICWLWQALLYHYYLQISDSHLGPAIQVLCVSYMLILGSVNVAALL